MKTRLLPVIALCLVFMLWQPVLALASIKDINGHWAQVSIEKWINDGLIAGYPDGQFKPDGEITRAEFVALVNRAFKIQNSETTYGFSDVEPAAWYYGPVLAGRAAGYISGYPDGSFKPTNTITRQEAAAIITKLLGLSATDKGVIEFFSDYRSIDNWARASVNALVAQGIMNGFSDKTFRAQKHITRAETIVTLERALQFSQKGNSGIKGIVKLAHQPVKGAAVKVFVKGSPEVLKETVTGEDGVFTFTVPQGQYEITAVQDKNVGYSSVTVGNATAEQEILLAQGARVSGKIQDKSGNPVVNLPVSFSTNPSFGGNTNNSGIFSIVLPLTGNNGQALTYSGAYLYNGTWEVFVTNQQFNGDTDLGLVSSNIPGKSQSVSSGGGGGGGGNLPPSDTTAPSIQSATVSGNTLIITFTEALDPSSQPEVSDFNVKVNGIEQALSDVAISGSRVTITLVEAVKKGDSITVSYGLGANPIRDRAGNNAKSFTNQSVVNLTSDPVVPPIDPNRANSFLDSTAFLYSGDNAVQTGVAPDTIKEQRAAVIRGKVLTREGTPLSDVHITILDHPEFGSTLSRQDGFFDMAVNGGGLLTVRYEKEGYLTAQRQVNVPWQDYAVLPEVILIPYDSKVTAINLNAAVGMQVARGSEVIDNDGARQATLFFPEGVKATIGGREVSSLHVRATEYTVGPNGPQAMPAELPPNVGYTYCVEYSVDEAIAGGGRVTFSEPVIHYVENFLGFPVGGIVPMGYYDYEQAAWIPSQNGRIIKILEINDGMASLDIDGNGLAADAAALATLGVTDAERQKLATLYQPGQSLWRVPITHFTPWDCNWPYGPPVGSRPPDQPPPRIYKESDPCLGSGSIIEYQNQVLGESAKVYGTPFTLNYRSSRVAGNINDRTLHIPLCGDIVPPSLREIKLEISIAGRLITKSFTNQPNQSHTFVWDGKDAYGRTMYGSTPVKVRIGYLYPIVYLEPSQFDLAFARYGEGFLWEVQRRDMEVTMWQEWNGELSQGDNTPQGLGNWSLNVHHSYDPKSHTLYLGDGQSRSYKSGSFINIVAGNGQEGYTGDGGPATQASLNFATSIAMGPDGSLYFADSYNNCIRKVGTDGIINTIAGSGIPGYTGDGSPAISSRLSQPANIALGPDGSIYVTSYTYPTVRKIDPRGIITTVVGNPSFERGNSGDGGPATQAQLNQPSSIAVGPDGSLYIADSANNNIRRVGPDGIITTVAGTGEYGFSGDGGPAIQAQFKNPSGIAVGPDGSLFIGDYNNCRIRRVGTDGIITTVAGKGYSLYNDDWKPAIEANIVPEEITVAPDGSLYFQSNQRILKVGTDGIISTVAGGGERDYSDGNCPANLAKFNSSGAQVAIGPDGSIYFADAGNWRICRLGYPISGTGELLVPSEGGTEMYVFDSSGRHIRTISTITGSEIYSFDYDDQNRLTAIKDAYGNVTSIRRDDQGNPTAIVAPGGQTTGLKVNEAGYLSEIVCPLEKKTSLEYNRDGLLTKLTDHKGNEHIFTYDESGLLIRDKDPSGGFSELSRKVEYNSYEVDVTTAEGRVSNYKVEYDYQGIGNVRRVNTDASGAQTQIIIKNDGTREVTYPDGTVITVVQGPDPRPLLGMRVPVTKKLTITSPQGLSSEVTRERTLEMADPEAPFGITKMTDVVTENGRTYTTTYDIDKDKQMVTITSTTPEGRETISILDWHGRVIEESTPGLAPIKYSYNAKGHLERVEQGDQILEYTYDDMNRLKTLTDAAGAEFRYDYNGADLLTAIRMPGGETYKFSYDANGNTTGITMPSGVTHQLDYTEVDLPESYQPPGNNSYEKSYNRDRMLTQLTLPSGRKVKYEYDEGGRITGINYHPVATTFDYQDLTNRVTGIESNGVDYTFVYDGSLVTEMTVSGEVYGSYSYSYNDDFNLLGITLDGGKEVHLDYDRDGLLTKYGPFEIRRGEPTGAPSKITNVSMTITYGYDNFGRPNKRIHEVDGKQIYTLDIAYDHTGLIKEKDEEVAGTEISYRYTYDANKQLTGVSGTAAESYAYDENGNRLQPTAHYDAQDRLTSLNGVNYEFDVDGFLAKRGSDIFEYTAQGELSKATLANDKEIFYTYDGLNRRVARSVVEDTYGEQVTEQYLYGNPGNPFQVTAYRDSSGLSQYYYDQNNYLFAIEQGDQWYYVATDQQGTPRVISDASGDVIKIMNYDSFGKLISDSNPAFKLPIGFAGGITDPDTQLVHFGLRDYDPAAGRWTARDPILFNGQQGNLYVYVGNNPVNLRDPSGLFCIGGSLYGGFGGGGQLCITGAGASLCAEVGFGVGSSVEVVPFGDLARNGSEVGIQGELTFAGIGPGGELTLDDCGTLKFTGAMKVGPFSQSASYDFLEEKWSTGDFSTGGEADSLKKNWLGAFEPKVGGSFKVYGRKCLQI